MLMSGGKYVDDCIALILYSAKHCRNYGNNNFDDERAGRMGR